MGSKDSIKEVSHTKTDNSNEGIAIGALTGYMPPYRAEHEVVVERGDGTVGVGHGATHEEARDEAIRDTGKK